jgi:myb proto-oncogene protein
MSCTQRQGQGISISSKPKVRKGLWSPAEDEKLMNYVAKNGLLACSWTDVAKQAGN